MKEKVSDDKVQDDVLGPYGAREKRIKELRMALRYGRRQYVNMNKHMLSLMKPEEFILK